MFYISLGEVVGLWGSSGSAQSVATSSALCLASSFISASATQAAALCAAELFSSAMSASISPRLISIHI